MTANASSTATYTPRYEQRVKLVQGIVREHSTLDDAAASELAVHMLHALDTIPEKLR
ncbi:hypothetical protein SAMN05216266_1075 [Amycolatopsis marina]|uniref:Uncharacterized protein n=1 Tax=Amycolatopsis marina TaxID=490629 RepID=A0A1I0ZHG4_9PSEU|nr:DUF6307 family protein [Amycolatopsis marina]SFB25209.1 hypothetical protein SAMN05216266_1075 [Amycolatopsis marina]